MQSYLAETAQPKPRELARMPQSRRLFMFLAMTVFAALQQPLHAQPPKKLTVEERALTTADNVSIQISYYKSPNPGKETPVIVMLHGKGGNRRQYKTFASELQAKSDFSIVTVDLRGHGDSQLKKGELKKGDYQAMVTQDLEAVHDFLLEEHEKSQLNINKLGIVATEFSASVAMAYTELDWSKVPYDDNPNPLLGTPRGHDVQALALISPDPSTSGLFASKSATALKALPVAVMIAASEKEKNGHDLNVSRKLFEQMAGKKDKEKDTEFERFFFGAYPEAVKGMDLILKDAALRSHIFGFMDKYVKQSNIEWRERKSALLRD